MKAFLLLLSFCLADPPPPPAPSPNEVAGLKITPGRTLADTRDLFTVEAECKGDVRFDVVFISGAPVTVVESEHKIILPIPEPGTVVYVSCVGLVDGKLTPVARSVFPVESKPAAESPPKSSQRPVGKQTITVFADTTFPPWVRSPTFKQKVQALGHTFRVVNAAGRKAAVVFQDEAGKVLRSVPLPTTEEAFLDALRR